MRVRVKLNLRRNLADDDGDWEGSFLGRTEVVWDGFNGLDQSMDWTGLDGLHFGREFLWPFPSLPFKLLSGLVLCRYLFFLALCMGSWFACSSGERVVYHIGLSDRHGCMEARRWTWGLGRRGYGMELRLSA